MEKQKINYYHQLIESNKNDIKKQWRSVNSVLGNKQKKNSIDFIYSDETQTNLTNNPSEIASSFNSFFMNVVNRVSNACTVSNLIGRNNYKTVFLGNSVQDS